MLPAGGGERGGLRAVRGLGGMQFEAGGPMSRFSCRSVTRCPMASSTARIGPPYKASVRWIDPVTKERPSKSEFAETEQEALAWIDTMKRLPPRRVVGHGRQEDRGP